MFIMGIFEQYENKILLFKEYKEYNMQRKSSIKYAGIV